MGIQLTSRMAEWVENLGVHIATSTKDGFPTVIVVNEALVDGEQIKVELTDAQANLIASNITANPQVALAPGKIGAVRAPYQFKGKARLIQNRLEIVIDEIYCTKPGAEAGIRLDTLGYNAMKEFDDSRWTDSPPTP